MWHSTEVYFRSYIHQVQDGIVVKNEDKQGSDPSKFSQISIYIGLYEKENKFGYGNIEQLIFFKPQGPIANKTFRLFSPLPKT